MPQSILIPDDLYARIRALAIPFTDKEPADVIRRLVEGASSSSAPSMDASPISRATLRATRHPRERGVHVRLDGQALTAVSVRELYEKVLEYLAKKGVLNKAKTLLPYRTSSKRYLAAQTPVHPNGNPFVVPVGARGFYFEAHKSYSTGLSQLARFLWKIGVKLEYLAI